MQGIKRNDVIFNGELFEELLDGRDFIGFFVDLGMGQNQSRIGSESAQDLPGSNIVEGIKTVPQRCSVQSQGPAA